MKIKPTICAVIAVRNESQYLRFLLPSLAEQEIDVMIIDNDSTDDSGTIFAEFSGKPVIHVENLPHNGFSALGDRLKAKQALFQICHHNWIVHHDADEIMEHVKPGLNLRDAIEEADAGGYNALNFEEFVFLPEPGEDYFNRNYYKGIKRYYFFKPRANRLNRAWKNTPGVSNLKNGGHKLDGEQILFAPENHLLRHYIVLSQQHAYDKYLHRRYDPRDLQIGWHGNRLHFTAENLRLPGKNPYMAELDRSDDRDFNRTVPLSKHFWEWEK